MFYTHYANYVIWFSDPVEYAAAQASCGGNGYLHCPHTAALEFGIPWPLVGGPTYQGTKGIYTVSYSIGEDPGDELRHPLVSGVNLSSYEDSVSIPGQYPNPAPGPHPDRGDAGLTVWLGNIVFVGSSTTAPLTTSIPARRWITSFDIPNIYSGEGATATTGSLNSCREASRTVGGKGYAIRGANTAGTTYLRKRIDCMGSIVNPKTSWERFYIRINALGTNDLTLWRCLSKTLALALAGAILKIDTAGKVKVYSVDNANTETLLETSTDSLALGVWHKIDILLEYAVAGHLRVYRTGNLIIDTDDGTGNGLDNNDTHGSSYFGQQSASETLWDVDLDDWMCADVPNVGGVESLDSMDWLNGTHAQIVNAASSTHVDWTLIGGTELFNQVPILSSSANAASIVISSKIEALTDITDISVEPGVLIGPTAANIASFNRCTGTGELAKLGYSGPAAGEVTVTDINQNSWKNCGYFPSSALPTSLESLTLIKTRGTNALSTANVYGLTAIVESVGAWGIEDSVDSYDISNYAHLLRHNARYSNTPWAFMFAGAPDAPCFSIGGTYVGNGDVTILTLPAPVHFLWIRGLGAVSTGIKWFAAGLGGNKGTLDSFDSYGISRVYTDFITGETKVVIIGNDVESNKLGDTYQYIAFCDPGSRFNYCGSYNANSAVATKVIPFFNPSFLPEAGFIQKSELESAGINSLTYKGPGHTANAGQLITAASKANWGTFAPGSLTVRANNISGTHGEYNFSLWRMLDDNGYCEVQITSYTGNGGAARTITLPYPSLRYPLFAIVTPNGGAGVGYARDPSNAGVTSYEISNPSVSSNTAIVGGGIDEIHVGLACNANGIVYNVFVLIGSNLGWLNGTYYPPSIVSLIAPPGEGPGNGFITPIYNPPPNPIVTMAGGVDFDGSVSTLLVQNISGIYTLVTDKRNDTMYTGFGAATVDLKIPNPMFKTGYIGG